MMITVAPTTEDITSALLHTIKFEIDRIFALWDPEPAYSMAFEYVSENVLSYDVSLNEHHALELVDYCHQKYCYYKSLE